MDSARLESIDASLKSLAASMRAIVETQRAAAEAQAARDNEGTLAAAVLACKWNSGYHIGLARAFARGNRVILQCKSPGDYNSVVACANRMGLDKDAKVAEVEITIV